MAINQPATESQAAGSGTREVSARSVEQEQNRLGREVKYAVRLAKYWNKPNDQRSFFGEYRLVNLTADRTISDPGGPLDQVKRASSGLPLREDKTMLTAGDVREAEEANWEVIFGVAQQIKDKVGNLDPQARFREKNVRRTDIYPAMVRFELADGANGREDFASLGEMVDQLGVDKTHLASWLGPNAPGDRSIVEQAAKNFLARRDKVTGQKGNYGDPTVYVTGLVDQAEEALKLYRDSVVGVRDREHKRQIANLTKRAGNMVAATA